MIKAMMPSTKIPVKQFLVFLLLSIGVISIYADEEFQLHDVNGDEYLNALVASSPITDYGFLNLVQTELTSQYADIAWSDYELVLAAHDAFDIQPHDVVWLPMLVVSWLNSHDDKLVDNMDITIDTANIHVTAIDLDADGQDEWMLDYNTDTIAAKLFISLNQEGHYTSIPQPLAFNYDYGYGQSTTLQILDIQDFTQDDQLDIAILETTVGETSSSQKLHILSLSDHKLIDVSDASLSIEYQHSEPQWEILNLDDDNALEIQQVMGMQDNWVCAYHRTSHFDWQDEHITLVDKQDEYSDFKTCNLRLAEEAMWAGDFSTAIEQYQIYLDYDPTAQYPTFRMAIAHILNGQMEQGIAILQKFQREQAGQVSYTLLPLANQVLDAYAKNPLPTMICLAAYDYFAFNAYAAWFNESLEVGFIIDNIIYEQGMHSPRIPSPDRAGCDFPAMLDAILANSTFATDRSPVDQLANLDIVSDITFHDDLNGDGIQDWIVWMPTIRISPVFFLSNGQNYEVSRPPISQGYPLNQDNSLWTIHLPDNSGLALLNVDFSEHYQTPSLMGGYGGGPGNCRASGNLEIWQLRENELSSLLNSLLCEVSQPLSTVDNVDEAHEIYAWAFNRSMDDYAPITYVWDADSQSFLVPPELEVSFDSSRPNYQIYSPLGLYLKQDFEHLFAYHAEAVAITDPDESLLEWRYVTALALEDIGHDDEALAEYVTIYQSNPDSAWGILAQLHFSLMDTQ